ncbi:hypothetical protein FXO38_25070 [Capsicum annuum]|nr:hypothetical protein FXO38_25070 [Capsicum annuum]
MDDDVKDMGSGLSSMVDEMSYMLSYFMVQIAQSRSDYPNTMWKISSNEVQYTPRAGQLELDERQGCNFKEARPDPRTGQKTGPTVIPLYSFVTHLGRSRVVVADEEEDYEANWNPPSSAATTSVVPGLTYEEYERAIRHDLRKKQKSQGASSNPDQAPEAGSLLKRASLSQTNILFLLCFSLYFQFHYLLPQHPPFLGPFGGTVDGSGISKQRTQPSKSNLLDLGTASSFRDGKSGIVDSREAMHIMMLHPSKKDMVHGFTRGLVLLLHLAMKSLIAVGSSFSQVVDYTRSIERECIETYRGGDKRTFLSTVLLVFHLAVSILPVELDGLDDFSLTAGWGIGLANFWLKLYLSKFARAFTIMSVGCSLVDQLQFFEFFVMGLCGQNLGECLLDLELIATLESPPKATIGHLSLAEIVVLVTGAIATMIIHNLQSRHVFYVLVDHSGNAYKLRLPHAIYPCQIAIAISGLR